LIYLTELGKINRDASRLAVRKFNQAVIDQTGEESIKNFHSVIEKINELTKKKNIFTF
jgi:hypothetical protein